MATAFYVLDSLSSKDVEFKAFDSVPSAQEWADGKKRRNRFFDLVHISQFNCEVIPLCLALVSNASGNFTKTLEVIQEHKLKNKRCDLVRTFQDCEEEFEWAKFERVLGGLSVPSLFSTFAADPMRISAVKGVPTTLVYVILGGCAECDGVDREMADRLLSMRPSNGGQSGISLKISAKISALQSKKIQTRADKALLQTLEVELAVEKEAAKTSFNAAMQQWFKFVLEEAA